MTIVTGGIPEPLRAHRGRQRRRRADRKSFARRFRRSRHRNGAGARSQGTGARRSAVCVQDDGRPRHRSAFRSAGGNPQRHRPPGDFRRALGWSGAIARQALAVAAPSASCPAPPPTRHSRCCRRAITSRARSARSPTFGSRRANRRPTLSAHFLDQNLPMLILADVGNVAGDAHDRLARWIEDGGVLVRFAGPRLAASDDDLVPVRLRRGGRILGGSLSWDKPQPLAAFSRESPFAGMTRAERCDRQPAGAGRTRCGADAKIPGRRLPTARRWSPRRGAAKV